MTVCLQSRIQVKQQEVVTFVPLCPLRKIAWTSSAVSEALKMEPVSRPQKAACFGSSKTLILHFCLRNGCDQLWYELVCGFPHFSPQNRFVTCLLRSQLGWSAWVAQLVKCRTLDFSSGNEIQPHGGLGELSGECA